MCTSSMIYTLYLPACGANRTCSTNARMSSTELLEAASSSWMFMDVPLLNETQEWQVLQASPSACRLSQLMVFARIRAQVVLPTPRGPQNKKACARWLLLIAFFSVVVMCSCPTTVSNVWGRYFLAETTNFSMINGSFGAGCKIGKRGWSLALLAILFNRYVFLHQV